jgi:hypothetical protein
MPVKTLSGTESIACQTRPYGFAIHRHSEHSEEIYKYFEGKDRPIRTEETAEARRLIYSVAHELMEPHMSLEEVTAQWDA